PATTRCTSSRSARAGWLLRVLRRGRAPRVRLAPEFGWRTNSPGRKALGSLRRLEPRAHVGRDTAAVGDLHAARPGPLANFLRVRSTTDSRPADAAPARSARAHLPRRSHEWGQ